MSTSSPAICLWSACPISGICGSGSPPPGPGSASPGAMTASEGMITELYRYFASQTAPEVKVTENGELPQYTCCSYFPEDKSVCLLNIDFDRPHQVEVHYSGKTEIRTLAPAEFVKFKL